MLWIAPQLQYARYWLLDHWYIYQAALVIVMSALVIAAEANVAAPYKTGVITALTAGGGIELLRDILGREADKRRIAAAHDATDRERRRRTRAERRAAEAERRAQQSERENAELRRRLQQQENGAE